MGKGLVTLIILPFVSLFLFMTLVGIPFGIIGLLSFVMIIIFAWILTPIIVGSVVYRYFSKRDWEVSWKTILLGVFLFTLLGIVPFLGSFAQMLLSFITLGSVVTLKFRILKEWR